MFMYFVKSFDLRFMKGPYHLKDFIYLATKIIKLQGASSKAKMPSEVEVREPVKNVLADFFR